MTFQQQFWFKNVQLTGVSAMTKAATTRLLANTSSAIFKESNLSIPTLPSEQLHGRYKADAWSWFLAFIEINKSRPNMKTKLQEMTQVLVAAMTKLFRVSQKSITFTFLLLEMSTKSRSSLYRSCWVTWVPLFHKRFFKLMLSSSANAHTNVKHTLSNTFVKAYRNCFN